MSEATVIYPHQLFTKHPAIKAGRPIFLVEEPLFLTEFPIHTQKLLLHRLSMKAYERTLVAAGHTVTYLEVSKLTDTASVFKTLHQHGVTHLHIADTTDYWLEKRIDTAAHTHSFTLTRYESPLFILGKDDAVARYTKSKKHMARFYKQLRIDKHILIEQDNEPVGGQWSFDSDNRKKIPKGLSLPTEIEIHNETSDISEALTWLKGVKGEQYGEARIWIPWTHAVALEYLNEFISTRLKFFGDYEDAITMKEVRLFHSTLSPLINIGLLSPTEVIEAVITHGEQHDVELNCIEGFVRQVIGWREFIRASYECDGVAMRTKNFWNHTRPLPDSFWTATTGVLPLDNAIEKALTYGYNHHIERLMVLGNFMLLTKTNPDHVYRWFMAMYVDAYDWVMVPNVYGMSQFADGGIFATKPYISGSSYLKKMSDYPAGDWEELWTALYWNFISEHKDFFLSNHRLSMMPRLLEKMTEEKQDGYHTVATTYLKKSV
jgi:deoxyribodipyrimidine photolyase-related protein